MLENVLRAVTPLTNHGGPNRSARKHDPDWKADDTHLNRRQKTKREPPHTTLRGITGSFASSKELFDKRCQTPRLSPLGSRFGSTSHAHVAKNVLRAVTPVTNHGGANRSVRKHDQDWKANDTHLNRRQKTKREPPHTALRGITGSFASSNEPFD